MVRMQRVLIGAVAPLGVGDGGAGRTGGSGDGTGGGTPGGGGGGSVAVELIYSPFWWRGCKWQGGFDLCHCCQASFELTDRHLDHQHERHPGCEHHLAGRVGDYRLWDLLGHLSRHRLQQLLASRLDDPGNVYECASAP